MASHEGAEGDLPQAARTVLPAEVLVEHSQVVFRV